MTPRDGGPITDPVRWERIQLLFHDALDRPPAGRDAFVRARAANDTELAAQVLALLTEDARGDSLLDRDVAYVAHDVLVGDGAPTLPTDRFGPYRLIRLLGEGGMGVVYLAERADLGSRVAIKILRDAWLSPARRERFAAEQRTLAQLNHPSIARLYDADTLPDGTPWFVMEYVEGVPITEYCATRDCSLVERLGLLRAVCEAVQYAHGQAIIHRDLKPSNILVRDDGTVKLLDFGIAKQLESLDAPADQTQTGLRLMTPAYAAPEQIRAGRVGVYTDVYALGVVLYELLTGARLYDLSNRTPSETESIVVEQEPDRPSVRAVRTGVSYAVSAREWADLDVLCLTAMRKDPARRYRTVDALIRDLDHYRRAEPLDARPEGVGYRAGKFLRRNWRAVSLTAVMLALLIGVVAFYTVRLTTARNAALAEAARAQRTQQFMLRLFQGDDEAAGPADSLRVVTLVDRGAREARGLSAEPAVQAELYHTLGGIYQSLGDFDRADTLLQAALRQRRRLFGPSSPDVAGTLVALGGLRAEQAKFEEGERMVRQGLEISRRTLPPNHPAIAKAIAALGSVLEEHGDYDRAIAVVQEGVQAQSGASTPELASLLGELANNHFYLGHYAIADSLNRRVLAMDRTLYGDRHPRVAEDLVNIGAVQFEWGRYSQSEQYYRQALEITRAWYGDNHPATASKLTLIGRALIHENRYDDAMVMLRQALATQERIHGPVHPAVASALNEIGTVALQHQQYAAADAAFRRMTDIYHAVYGDRHYLLGIALSNRGSVALAQKNYTAAEGFYRDALHRFEAAQGPRHLNAGIAHIKLGRTLLRAGRFSDAEREILVGSDIMNGQTSSTVSWLQAARGDLALVYDSLGHLDSARAVRDRIAAIARDSATTH